MRIPRYAVQDDSYVEVFEQNKSVADAVAQSSLSEVSAELAMYVWELSFQILCGCFQLTHNSGGGGFGYSAGLKAGVKYETNNQSASTKTTDTKVMTITYNVCRLPRSPLIHFKSTEYS